MVVAAQLTGLIDEDRVPSGQRDGAGPPAVASRCVYHQVGPVVTEYTAWRGEMTITFGRDIEVQGDRGAPVGDGKTHVPRVVLRPVAA